MLLLIAAGWVLLAVLVLPLVAVLGRAGVVQDGAQRPQPTVEPSSPWHQARSWVAS